MLRRHAQYVAEHGLGEAHWRALGTSAHVVVTAPERLPAARAAIEGVLHQVDLAASRFRGDSELTAVNRAQSRPVRVSEMLVRALRVALDAAGRGASFPAGPRGWSSVARTLTIAVATGFVVENLAGNWTGGQVHREFPHDRRPGG